ncbi:MAG: fucose isomerase [Planctomycetota bacterium]|nr:fucose isomerase [Planctomycetota bacterium]
MAVQLENIPKVRIGVVGVSRACFPISLTRSRMAILMPEIKKLGVDAYACETIVEKESNIAGVMKELADNGCTALFVYLGNFGPETPTTILMQRFPGPVMAAAAAEENKRVLASDRGDALCGLLNISYNLRLRGVKAYIPPYPVGLPHELAPCVVDFVAIARVVVGVRNLKLFGFGPRPDEFLACNAPVKPLYDLGVEIMENSELDLLEAFKAAGGEKALIKDIAADMEKDLGGKVPYPDLLPKLAQLEAALLKWKDAQLGVCSHAAFANKCWPAFEPAFGFVPCYVNSHMTGRGYPVSCEVDFYGALSEFMAQCATLHPSTILDINNSAPDDVVPAGADLRGAERRDLFMGFHCGNTCTACMKNCAMQHHVIMKRGLEPEGEPNLTRGTMEGQIKPGDITFFRLQSSPANELRSYIAEGEVLDLPPRSFGSIGIFAIPDFARFYRHILVGKGYPHHGAVAFAKVGEVLYEAVRLLGVDDIGVPLPAGDAYPGENRFSWKRK